MGRRRRRRPAPRGITDITDLADNARGVGRTDGKAVFVADALPGERVVYRPSRQKRDFDEAELVTLLSASPERTTPRCRHFGVCGGCALQHAEADAQVAFKQRQLLEALVRIGKVAPEATAAPITDRRWAYRRRARLGVKHVPKKGGALVGFRERGSPFIAVLTYCHVLVADVGARLPQLGRLVNSLSIAARIPQIEVAAGDNITALVFRVLASPSACDRQRLRAFAREHGFSIYLQPGDERSIVPLDADAPALYYELPNFDARLYFEPADFVQIHGGINARMVDQAVAALMIEPGDTVVDLFAGLGNFSVPLARRARRVLAVEGEMSLVERAHANADANGLDNLTVQHADLLAPGAAPAWAAGGCDKALLDPPRAGAAAALPALAAAAPRRIVYCSCHPATLARDAAVLVHEYGYRLVTAGIADMFPHTAHVESMAVFERGAG